MPAFEQLRASYRALWNGMAVLPGKANAADTAARRIVAGKDRYQRVERRSGVPWFFIGLCHMREGNFNFETYLGNGQSIHRVTTIVPKGRGPFATFEDGAVDALQKQGLTGVHDWSLERIAYSLEAFNGFGYRNHGVNSPYLWAGTNRYSRGKYVSDGVFDPHAVDAQLGSMAVLARLAAIDVDVSHFVQDGAKAEAPIAAPPSPAPPSHAAEGAPIAPTPIALPAPAAKPSAPPAHEAKHDGWFTGVVTAAGLALAAAYHWLLAYLPEILIGIAVLIVVGLILYRIIKGRLPWTGQQSPVSLPLSHPSSAASSAAPLLAHLAALQALSPATPSPAPSASRRRRQRSATRFRPIRRRRPKSKSSRPSTRTRSSSKRKSKSRR